MKVKNGGRKVEQIKINCDGSGNIKLSEIKQFQGKLKDVSEENLAKIIKSIERHGFIQPFAIWKDKKGNNNILDGHTRLKALAKMGENLNREYPVYEVQAATENEARRILLQKSSEYGIITPDGLSSFMESAQIGVDEIGDFALPNIDIDGFGQEELDEIQEDDYDVEKTKEVNVKNGEVYLLGEHRLMCGDSTNDHNVAELMNGEKGDMVFTDPPYGVSYTGGKLGAIMNDDLRGNNLASFLVKFLQLLHKHTKDNIATYIWFSANNHIIFEQAAREAGFEVKQEIIWNKGMVLSHLDYHNAFEPVLYCKKAKQRTRWYGDRTSKTILRQRRTDLLSLKKEELVQIVKNLLDNSTVWEIDRDSVKTYAHPTQKPLALAGRAIINSSQQENLVIDMFGGSGSTLMACDQIKRKCYTMELDPFFAQVIIDRWEESTGEKAVKVK